jgi:RHS repeat-associated protein
MKINIRIIYLKTILVFFINILCLILLNAQNPPEQSVVLFSDQDAYIKNTTPTTNYGSDPSLHAMSWTDHGSQVIIRSLVHFDVNSIPQYSTIVSATFTLFGIGHHIIDQSDLKLNVVTDSWQESTVNWTNQPAITVQDEITVALGGGSQTQDLIVDLAQIVQKWVDGEISNYGIQLSLKTETGYIDYNFGSSEFATEGYHPQLDIIYAEQIITNLEIYPEKDAVIMNSSYSNGNFGNEIYFRSYSWPLTPDGAASAQQTPSGTQTEQRVVARSLIEFDLPTIPPNSTIHKATISLFGINHYRTANASYLKRVTSAWEENTVTWNTQPGNNSQYAAFLESSRTPVQNYEVDITDIVQGWINGEYENHGLLLMLQNEASTASLSFGSSDYSNSAKHPKINIAYTPAQWTWEICPESFLKNFVYTVVYNGDDITYPVSEVITYYNNLGKPLQSQSKLYSENFANDTILASQPVYDAMGRPAIQTLLAPLGKPDPIPERDVIMCYSNGFMTNPEDEPYSYIDFDIVGSGGNIYNPSPVGINCALGKYYSEANDVSYFKGYYVPSDPFPFSRTEFSKLNPGVVRRSTLAGEPFKMGSGHEIQNYSMITNIAEIQGYEDNPFNPGFHAYQKVIKEISVDPDGKESIIFSDFDGNILSSAISNLEDESIEPINLHFSNGIENSYVDLHVTDIVGEQIIISGAPSGRIIKRYDLTNDELIDEIETSGSNISFNGLEKRFYRIEISGLLTELEAASINVTYNSYYENFSFSYYDLAGRSILTLPPEGSYIENMGARNTYNSLNWILSSHSSENVDDVGIMYYSNYVYRKDGAIRFSQNPSQDDDDKFSYTNYDNIGRIIEVGEYDMNLGTRVFQTYEEFVTDPDPQSVHYILDNIYNEPWNDAGCTQQTHTYYDLPDPDLQIQLLNDNFPPDVYKQRFLDGTVSKSWNANNTTWYSYDEQGSVEWMIQKITGLSGLKTIDYEYDFNGNVTKVIFMKYKNLERFDHDYLYDKNKRLQDVFTQMPEKSEPPVHQTKYYYYTHGTLKREEIAIKNKIPLQGIDYVYTINGWLKSINDPELNKPKPNGIGLMDPGGDDNDIFGMSLDYFFGDYQRKGTYINYGMLWNTTNETNDLFNGNIRSERWNINDNSVNTGLYDPTYQWAFHYKYNKKDWLTDAVFGHYLFNDDINTPSGTTVTENSNFSLIQSSFPFCTKNLTYDLNGNILSLDRNGNFTSGLALDQLSYTYNPYDINRLRHIRDAVPNSIYEDDIESQVDDNYSYNKIGQMIKDESMGTYKNIIYTVYGLVKGIYNNAGNPMVEYLYDDRGYRIKKIDYQQSQTTFYVRDAIGNILCINEGEALEYPLYGSSRIGILKTDRINYFDYEYELYDHLGNVRVIVFRSTNDLLKVKSYTDYYPFGWTMPGRTYEPNLYRFGYQGQFTEKDQETGFNQFEYRLWDGRIGRWLTTDIAGQYWSPYLGMGNRPTNSIDPNGAESIIPWFLPPNYESTSEAIWVDSEGKPPPGWINMGDDMTFGTAWLSETTINGLRGSGSVVRAMEQRMNSGYNPNWIIDFNRAVGYGYFAIDAILNAVMLDMMLMEISGMNESVTLASAQSAMNAVKSVTQVEKSVFTVTKEGVVLPKGAKIPGEFVENAHRSSNYGIIQNGKYIEKVRIDPATPAGFKGPNESHFHLNNGDHIFDATKWPWW